MTGRPKGKKSTYSAKNTLTSREELEFVKDYSTMKNVDLLDKYRISKSQLRNIRIRRNLKSKNLAQFLTPKAKLEDLKRCGVYAMVRIDAQKAYFGSSVNIYKRIVAHIYDLSNNNHYNKALQDDWNENEFYFCLISEVGEDELLEAENDIIDSLDDFVLYNKNKTQPVLSPKDYRAVWSTIKDRIVVDDNGCWVYNRNIKADGYPCIKYKYRYLRPHRVAFIVENNKFPYLVGHLCNNKLCCNPDHLKSKSHRENVQYTRDSEDALKRSRLYEHKDKIIELRKAGATYVQIGEIVEANAVTVYNFCRKLVERGAF